MSYKLKYTGKQIDDILDRAVEGGTIDDALALKAPLESPALTGTPTAPTQAEGDDSTKVATTAYADRAADAAETAAKEYTDEATSALYITDTASGSIASFSDGADGVAMRSVKVAITPVQSGSGDPSPDNVRPISGWTQAEVTRTGVNVGQTYPISWETQAGEVFGGYFVINEDGSVDLTVDHKGITLTSADQLTGFTTSAQYGAFASIVGSNDIKHENSATIYGLCSCAEFIAYNNRVAQAYIEKFRCWADTNNGVLIVRASASSNIQAKADLYAEFANGQFVYLLATPQTYHLDSIGQITSLLGQNNVWSNTGDVEVEYVADPKLYIAKMLGGGALTLGSASPLSLNRPVTINEEDLEQADEVNEAVEAAAETVQPAESGETEEGVQE